MVDRIATNRVLAAFTYNNVIMCSWKIYVQYIPCKDTLMLVAGIMDKHVCQCSLRWKPSTNQIAGRNPGWTKILRMELNLTNLMDEDGAGKVIGGKKPYRW